MYHDNAAFHKQRNLVASSGGEGDHLLCTRQRVNSRHALIVAICMALMIVAVLACVMLSISSLYNNKSSSILVNNTFTNNTSIILMNNTYTDSNMILANNTHAGSNANGNTTNTTRAFVEFPRLVKKTLKSVAKAVTTDEPTEATNQVATSTKVKSSPRHPNMPAPGSETQDILLSVFLACLLDGGINC